MKIDNLGRLPGIKPDLIPPKCKKTGEAAVPVGFSEDGRTVYERWILDRVEMKKQARPMTDLAGNPVTRKRADGTEYTALEQPELFRKQRFVLDPHPGGHVFIQEQFEATPEEKAADKAKRDRNEFLEKLADQATANGVTVEQLVEGVVRSAGLAPKAAKAVEGVVEGAVEAPDFPFHRGGGNYVLSNGERFKGTREDAEAAEAALEVAEV